MKKIFIILSILVILPILVAGIFLLTFDLNRYRGLVETELSQSLQVPVKIGSMKTKLALIPTISISNFKILTPQNNKTILDIPSMETTIELAPLIEKKIVVQKINIPHITVDLTNTEKKGQSKSVPAAATKVNQKNTRKDLSKLLWIENIQIGKMLLIFQKDKKKESFTMENFHIKKMTTFELNFNHLKNNFTIKGNFGNLTDFLGTKNNLPIDLKITHKNNVITLNGQIDNLAQMSKIRLDLNAQIANLSDFISIFTSKKIDILNFKTNFRVSAEGDLKKLLLKKIDFSEDKRTLSIKGEGSLENIEKSPLFVLNLASQLQEGDLSKKFKLNPFEITNKLKFNQGKIEIDNLKYMANKTDFSGKIILDFNPKPMNIEFILNSNYLTLKDIFSSPVQNISSAQNNLNKQSVIPEIQIPWAFLKSFDLNGQIQIKNVNLSTNIDEYSSINIRPVLKNGIFTSPFQFLLLTGSVNSILRLNQNDQTIQFKLEAKNISLDKARGINKEVKNAFVDSDISIQTKGSTTKEILENSFGKIEIELIGGEIISPLFNDLIEKLESKRIKNAFSTTQHPTNVLCGAVNLTLANGILTSQDKVVLQTEPLNLILNGQINLNNETLEVSVIPKKQSETLSEKSLTDLIQEIKLSGTWKDPQLSLDTKKIISSLFTEKLPVSKPDSKTSLCEKVLGRSIRQPIKNQKIQMTQAAEKEAPKHKTKLKDQLLESLSQVLSKKAQ